jgi:hypothetical protein
MRLNFNPLIFWVFAIMSVVGCTSKMEHVKCPGFNFDSLGADMHYFNKTLFYSNGYDTIQMDCVDWASSGPTEFYRGNGIVGQCIPSFSVTYSDRLKDNQIYYNFSSPDFSKFLYLDLHLNFRSVEIRLDTIHKFGSTHVPIIDTLETHHRPPSELSMVTSFELEKYRVVCYEKSNGERWDLIKIQ